MSKKILILTPFYPPNVGGAESFTEGLAKEASQCNDIIVLTYQPFRFKARKREKFYSARGSLSIHRMNWLFSPIGAWRGSSLGNFFAAFPKMVIGLYALNSKEKCEIVHAQGLIAGLAAVLLKRIFRYKVFITLLALYGFDKWTGIKKEMAKFIFNNCDLVFVEGENGLRDIGNYRPKDKLIIFNHWVDQEVFCPPKERAEGKIKAIFIGRPIKEKGRHIVQQAEQFIKDHNGFMPMEFKYVEDISFQELPKVYQWADVVVIPSLYAEGYSRVVAEAASCGCAVVTSNRGSLPEMVKDFGIAVEPTPENIAFAIPGKFLKDWQEKAYNYAKENFSSKNAEAFRREYEKC